MSKTTYRQCCLMRALPGGATSYQTTWLPRRFCEIGLNLKLRDESGEWEDGWRVTSVGETVLDDAPDYRKAIRVHRLETGDDEKPKARSASR
jgi:hypothetical protein